MPRAKPTLTYYHPRRLPGVKFLTGLTEGAGYPAAFLGGVRTLPSVTGAPTWSVGPSGKQVSGFSTSNFYSYTTPAQILLSTFPCWIAVMASNTTPTTQQSPLFSGSTASNTPACGINIQDSATAGRFSYFLRDNASVNIDVLGVTSSGTTSDGLPHVLMGVSYAVNDHRMFVDGLQLGTSSSTIGAVTLTNISVGTWNRTTPTNGAVGTSVMWGAAGNGAVPDPFALYQDLISGRFSSIRAPRRKRRAFFSLGGTSVTVTPGPLVGSGTLVDPAISGTAVVGASPLIGSGTLVSPAVSGTAIVSASPLVGSATLVSPAISGDANVSPNPLVGSGTLPSVSIAVAGSITVSVSPLVGSGVLVSPTVTGDANVSAGPLIGTGTLPTATVGDGTTTDVVVDVGPLVGFGTIVQPQILTTNLYRDYDIWMDICRRLEATKAFDRVYRCSAKEIEGKKADDLRAVCVEPMGEVEGDIWDGYLDPEPLVTSQIQFTFMVRNKDPLIRYAELDRLRNIARNALNGKCLLGMTFPAYTKFLSHKTAQASPPEQQMRSIFTYKYEVGSPASFATEIQE